MLDPNISNPNNNHTTKPQQNKNNSRETIDHSNDHGTTPQESSNSPPPPPPSPPPFPSHGVDDAKKRVGNEDGDGDGDGDGDEEEVQGRERLKRHRRMAMEEGQVLIPEVWGHEELLRCWFDCSAFESGYAPAGFVRAREALARERAQPSCTSSAAELKVELDIQKSS